MGHLSLNSSGSFTQEAHSGLRFRGRRAAPAPEGGRLRAGSFFGLGGGGLGSKIVGWPSTMGCGSSSSSLPQPARADVRQCRRIELGAKVDDQAPLFIGLDADDRLILRVIQKLRKLLEAKAGEIEFRMLLLHPSLQLFG